MNAGLNLFSLRTCIDTEEKFLETAKKLKELGYSFLQYSGAAFDAERIKRVSEASDMPVYLTHVPMDRITDDTDALMEEHSIFGCKNIGLGMMPIDVIADESRCKQTIEKLNRAGEMMQKNGFGFYYHHHQFEFFKHNGQTVFDYMIENAPYINFTVDTYWLQYGGADILKFMDKLNGRMGCVHFKDYSIALTPATEDKKAKLDPKFAPVGDGSLDFAAIKAKADSMGARYYFVEQDDACKYDDPFEQVGRSIRYIKENLK